MTLSASLIGDDSDEAMEEDDEEEELSEEEQLEKFIATIHPEKDPTKIVSRKKRGSQMKRNSFSPILLQFRNEGTVA